MVDVTENPRPTPPQKKKNSEPQPIKGCWKQIYKHIPQIMYFFKLSRAEFGKKNGLGF